MARNQKSRKWKPNRKNRLKDMRRMIQNQEVLKALTVKE